MWIIRAVEGCKETRLQHEAFEIRETSLPAQAVCLWPAHPVRGGDTCHWGLLHFWGTMNCFNTN